MCRTVSVVVLSLVLFSLPLAAQTPSQVAGPVLPDTITRGPDGNVTVRAVRLDEPLALDGELDEAVYERVWPASGFVQVEPNPGAQARDQTEIWIMFDDENVYMAARAWDSDMEIVTTEMRRDNLWSGNDIIWVQFRHLPRSAQLTGVQRQRAGRATRWPDDQREPVERRREPHLGGGHGTLRRRVDAGGRHPVQVAPLRTRQAADLGAPGAATQPVDQRDLVPHRTAACAGPGREPAGLTRGDTRGHRSATELSNCRAEAVSDLERHDGRAQCRR